ncbi:MAG: hypothetical protein H8F28_21790 [Fibrella sp.]|nr:hypothetical protein [Armatimonadota bacterium]
MAFRTFAALAALCTGSVLPLTAGAQTYHWTGAVATNNNNVSAGANWLGGINPPSGNTTELVFGVNTLTSGYPGTVVFDSFYGASF